MVCRMKESATKTAREGVTATLNAHGTYKGSLYSVIRRPDDAPTPETTAIKRRHVFSERLAKRTLNEVAQSNPPKERHS